jgi:hypothetical protein
MWARSRPVIPAVLVTDPEGGQHALSIPVPGRVQADTDSSGREFNSVGCAAEVCIESWGEQSAEAETERWRELSVSDRVEVANNCIPELNSSGRAVEQVDSLAYFESEPGHLSDFSTFGRTIEARNGRWWQEMSAVGRTQKKNGGRLDHGSGSDAESGRCRRPESRLLGRATAENDCLEISEKLWRLEETSTVQPTRFRNFDSGDLFYFLSMTQRFGSTGTLLTVLWEIYVNTGHHKKFLSYVW